MIKYLLLLSFFSSCFCSTKIITYMNNLNHQQLYDRARDVHVNICYYNKCPTYLMAVDIDSEKMVIDNLEEVNRTCLTNGINKILNKEYDKRHVLEIAASEKFNDYKLFGLFSRCKMGNNNLNRIKKNNNAGIVIAIIVYLLFYIFMILFLCCCIIPNGKIRSKIEDGNTNNSPISMFED